MKSMIDFNALSALATSALTQHQDKNKRGSDMPAVANGCGFPDEIAAKSLASSRTREGSARVRRSRLDLTSP
jgi:hypothetical protein